MTENNDSRNRLLPDLVTVEEPADALGKTPRTLNRWHVQRCGPPRVYISKTPYYDMRKVREWIEDAAAEQNADSEVGR